MPLQPSRTVAELRELRELTGDENGAQRVAWTDTWAKAREWLRAKVADTGATDVLDVTIGSTTTHYNAADFPVALTVATRASVVK